MLHIYSIIYIFPRMPKTKLLLKIGLTGGFASGKSTVANYFAELGIAIIDTDQIAREVTQPGTLGYQQIIQQFGTQLINANGTLNRSQLRTLIFSQPKQRRWLENLLHPLIRQELQHHLPFVTSPYCILVIPLLVETDSYSLVDRILVVDAPAALQIARAQQREQMAIEQVLAIIRAQADRQQRLAIADDVIDNTEDLVSLKQKIVQLHQHYLQLASAANKPHAHD
jgi:dephospho-CoA kinase